MPLHRAAREGHTDVIRTLIAAGADPNVRNIDNTIPLHCAAEGGHAKAVVTLLESGADPNARNSDEAAPLHYAAEGGHADVIGALIAAGADPNVTGSGFGGTPVHLAATGGHTEAVNALLEAGADPNVRDHDEDTPLHRAAWSGHAEAAIALLEAGADPNAQNKHGETILSPAPGRGGTDALHETLLFAAAERGVLILALHGAATPELSMSCTRRAPISTHRIVSDIPLYTAPPREATTRPFIASLMPAPTRTCSHSTIRPPWIDGRGKRAMHSGGSAVPSTVMSATPFQLGMVISRDSRGVGGPPRKCRVSAALAQLREPPRSSLIDACPVVQLDRSVTRPAFMFRPATAKLRHTT